MHGFASFIAAVAFAASALSGPALASQAVSLRPDVGDTDGVVTLGDLFEGAGAAARVPVATDRKSVS